MVRACNLEVVRIDCRRVSLRDPYNLASGEVAEWSNARAWKARVLKGTQGSNPCLSVVLFKEEIVTIGKCGSYDATY